MKYYIDDKTTLHAFNDDIAPDMLEQFIQERGLTPATPEQVQAIQNPPPPPTPPKLAGVEFAGVMCSATAEDQAGLLAVLVAWQLQGAAFAPTEFAFANGSKVTITAANIQPFIAVWMPFRQSFFAPPAAQSTPPP